MREFDKKSAKTTQKQWKTGKKQQFVSKFGLLNIESGALHYEDRKVPARALCRNFPRTHSHPVRFIYPKLIDFRHVCKNCTGRLSYLQSISKPSLFSRIVAFLLPGRGRVRISSPSR